MKILRLVIIVTLVAFIASCSNDDNNDSQNLSAKKLSQTTWNCTYYRYAYEGREPEVTVSYIMEFLSDTECKCITVSQDDGKYDDASYFKFWINGRLFTIKGSWFTNEWTVMEAGRNRFVLQAFEPQKIVLVFTRRF